MNIRRLFYITRQHIPDNKIIIRWSPDNQHMIIGFYSNYHHIMIWRLKKTSSLSQVIINHVIIILSYYYPLLIWLPLKDHLIIIWWLSDDHLKIIWWSYEDQLMSIWRSFLHHLKIIICLFEDYPVLNISWSSVDYDDYLITIWSSPEDHLKIIWLSSEEHLIIIWWS